MTNEIKNFFEIFFIFSIVSSIILLIIKLSNKKTRGLSEWMYGNISLGLGIYIIYNVETLVNATISIFVGSAFIILSYLFCYIGLQKFNDKKIENKIIIYSFVSYLLTFFLIHLNFESINSKLILSELYIIFLLVLILKTIYQMNSLNEIGENLFAISFLGSFILIFFKLIDKSIQAYQQDFVTMPLQSDLIFLAWGPIVIFFYTLGIILMINQRGFIKLKQKLTNVTNFYNVIKKNNIDQKNSFHLLSYDFLKPISSVNASNELIKKEIDNDNISSEVERIDQSTSKLINLINRKLKNQSLLDLDRKNLSNKIPISELLKTVAAEYEIIYQDKTNNANIFINQHELFKLLVSYFIFIFLKDSDDKSKVKIINKNINNNIEILITHDEKFDQTILINQLTSKKFIAKKFSYSTFENDIIEEVVTNLDIKIEYKYGIEVNILVLKFKKYYDEQ